MAETSRLGHRVEPCPDAPGDYVVHVDTVPEAKVFTLTLREDAEGLGDDEQTAHATVAFLLGRQDVMDLPDWLEIDEVIAAYPEATDAIRHLRDDA